MADALKDPQAFLVTLGLNEVQVILVDTTDGLRLTLNNGCVIHLRPSGNAPELRCYAEAESPHVATKIVTSVLDKIAAL